MQEQTETAGGAKTLMPVIDLFKKSFDVYLEKVWLLAGTVVFSFLSFLVLFPFAAVIFLISYGPFSTRNFDVNIILIDILLGLIGILLATIFGLWSQSAMYLAVKEDHLEFEKIIGMAWKKIGSLFWIGLLMGLAALGGFILFIIPGIIFSVWFCFSVFVFVSEDLRGTLALKRSKQLVQGYWWPVFWRLLAMGIVGGLIASIEGFGPIINLFIVIPFTLVFEYLLYKDLKRIKD